MNTHHLLVCVSIIVCSSSTACRASRPTTTPAESPAPAPEAAPAATTSPQNADMLDHIDRFLADPRRVDPAPIVDFALNSPDVMVVFGTNLEGIATGADVPEDAAPLLLAAFTAGNVKEQLIKAEKRDAPKAGFVALVQVYEVLARDTGLEIPDTAALARAHADGNLDAWMDDHPSE